MLIILLKALSSQKDSNEQLTQITITTVEWQREQMEQQQRLLAAKGPMELQVIQSAMAAPVASNPESFNPTIDPSDAAYMQMMARLEGGLSGDPNAGIAFFDHLPDGFTDVQT